MHVIDTFEDSMDIPKEKVKNLLNDFKENLASYITSSPTKTKIYVHKGISGEVIRTFGSKNKFDFIYIDGSHVARDVLEDAMLCWRLLKTGGVMIFDDYGWRKFKNPLLRPDLAINAFLQVFQEQYKVLHIGYQVAIEKRGNDVPIPTTVRKNNKSKNLFPSRDDLEKLHSTIDELSHDLRSVHSENNKLLNDLEKVQAVNKSLSNSLKIIQSAKVYKIWQWFCNIRKYLQTKMYKMN